MRQGIDKKRKFNLFTNKFNLKPSTVCMHSLGSFIAVAYNNNLFFRGSNVAGPYTVVSINFYYMLHVTGRERKVFIWY